MIRYEYMSTQADFEQVQEWCNCVAEDGWEVWKIEPLPVRGVLLVARRPLGWYQPDIDRARAWAKAWRKLARKKENTIVHLERIIAVKQETINLLREDISDDQDA